MQVLFVCLGNICRSPMAEGAFRRALEDKGLGDRVRIDSAGTGNWHIGEPPDPRAIAAAAAQGVDISGQRARQVTREDFHTFDLILGMDHTNVQNLTRMAAFDNAAVIDLYLGHAVGDLRDVPDPYFGDDDGFASVYRDINAGAEALVTRIAGTMSGDSA